MLPLLVVSLGYLMVILDATAVNVALPVMRDDFGAGPSALQWVLDAYTLVFAALLLSAGVLGDRVGARRLFAGGLLLFAVASAACGAAPSVAALVAARAAQGLGAALLVPSSLALVRAAYPDAAQRARALGAWGAIGGIGAAGGPLFGGLVASAVGWRAVFLVNVPIATGALALTVRHVPSPRRRPGVGLDLPGQLLAVAAAAAPAVALIEGGARGWRDPLVLAAALAGPLAMLAFVRRERRAPAPMLPLALLRRSAFGGGSAVGLLINLGFYGQLLVVTLLFEDVRGWDALHAGLALMPEAATVMAGSLLAGRLTARGGPRPPMLAGLACGAAGLLALAALGPHAPYPALAPALALTGFGMSVTMPAATAAVIGAAPAERAGTAAGTLNAARQLGGAIGVALLGTIAGAAVAPGFRAALLVAAAAFAAALAVTWRTTT